MLKEIINFYSTSGFSELLCFVDVCKAFDRVNYNLLFLKLHNRGTSLHIIGHWNFWFNTQQFRVSWDNKLSRSFGSANGLHHVGILSLNYWYTDDLSHQLSALPIWCLVDSLYVNNLCYADDMDLISPSVSGLQSLIDCCLNYATAHDIIIMKKTSVHENFLKPSSL